MILGYSAHSYEPEPVNNLNRTLRIFLSFSQKPKPSDKNSKRTIGASLSPCSSVASASALTKRGADDEVAGLQGRPLMAPEPRQRSLLSFLNTLSGKRDCSMEQTTHTPIRARRKDGYMRLLAVAGPILW